VRVVPGVPHYLGRLGFSYTEADGTDRNDLVYGYSLMGV